MMNRNFQQYNNMRGGVNPALYKAQLVNKLKDMQSSGVDPDAEIKRGVSEGVFNQEQADFVYSIARNVAKALFGYSDQN